MSTPVISPRIGIWGRDEAAGRQRRGRVLWPAGYAAAVTAAGGTPVSIELPQPGSVDAVEALYGLDGVVFLGCAPAAAEPRLCRWCRDQGMPLLAVDQGLHVLNATFGGTLHLDLYREAPHALQHQHLPERGDRHAITVAGGTRLARLYGAGEIVVNSEHCRAVCRVARGFRISARALDGTIEAIEARTAGWFAVGVQWRPASATASSLDIQLFRGLIEACRDRRQAAVPAGHLVAA